MAESPGYGHNRATDWAVGHVDAEDSNLLKTFYLLTIPIPIPIPIPQPNSQASVTCAEMLASGTRSQWPCR